MNILRGLVFIDKVKTLIKNFEESTREEIGIAILAYEEFISKGLKVSDKDLEKLTEIFGYYDEELSDDYPSLVNEALQDCDILITNYFSDEKFTDKDGYKINLNYAGNDNSSTSFEVEIVDNKTGILENRLNYNVNDSFTNSDFGKDSFNTIYNACEEVKKQIEKTDIKSILNTYKM